MGRPGKFCFSDDLRSSSEVLNVKFLVVITFTGMQVFLAAETMAATVGKVYRDDSPTRLQCYRLTASEQNQEEGSEGTEEAEEEPDCD